METWQEEIVKQIDEKLKGLKETDYRFFRIDEFKRNICRVAGFAGSCPTCKYETKHIRNIVSVLDEAINTPGKKRREYDRLISRLSKHMRKEHGFYPPYYFSYQFSFAGIIAGGILGVIFMQFNSQLKLELFLVGFAFALIYAYIWGSVKDKKIRKQKRLM